MSENKVGRFWKSCELIGRRLFSDTFEHEVIPMAGFCFAGLCLTFTFYILEKVAEGLFPGRPTDADDLIHHIVPYVLGVGLLVTLVRRPAKLLWEQYLIWKNPEWAIKLEQVKETRESDRLRQELSEVKLRLTEIEAMVGSQSLNRRRGNLISQAQADSTSGFGAAQVDDLTVIDNDASVWQHDQKQKEGGDQ